MHTYTLENLLPYSEIRLGLLNCHAVLQRNSSHDQLIVWNLETGECKFVEHNWPRDRNRIPSINGNHTVVHRNRASHEREWFNDIFSAMKFRMYELAEYDKCQKVPAPLVETEIEEEPKLAENHLRAAELYADKNREQSVIENFEEALRYTKKAEDYKKVCEYFASKGESKEQELAFLYLAVLYYQEENFEQARCALERSQQLSKTTKATLLLADYLHSQKNDNHAVGYYMTAAMSYKRGSKKSLEVARKIICCEPNKPDYYENLADLYGYSKSKFWIYLLALVHFAKTNSPDNTEKFKTLAATEEPHNPLVEIILIHLLKENGELTPEKENHLSIEAGKKLMKKNRHEEARHYFVRATSYGKDKDFDELLVCEEFSPEAVKNHRIKQTYKKWIEECVKRDDSQKAIKVYEQALERLPESAEMHLDYLNFLLRKRLPMTAEAILKEVSWVNENISKEGIGVDLDAIIGEINLELQDHPEEAFYRDLIIANHKVFSKFIAESTLRRIYQGWMDYHRAQEENDETIEIGKVAIQRFPNHVPYRLYLTQLIFDTKNSSEEAFLVEQIQWLNENKETSEAKERILRLFDEMFVTINDGGLNAFNINLITTYGDLFQKSFSDCAYAELFPSLFTQYINEGRFGEAMAIAKIGLESFSNNLEFRKSVFAFVYDKREENLASVYEPFIVDNCKELVIHCDESEVLENLEKLYEICIDLELAQELAKLYHKQNRVPVAAEVYLTTAKDAALRKKSIELEKCIQAIDEIGVSNCQFTQEQLEFYLVLESNVEKDQKLREIKKQVEANSANILNIIDSLPQPGVFAQLIARIRGYLTWSWQKDKVN